MHVLISGASVAGPALAYCLGRLGFDTTVVEQAPSLREGGYTVDFRGSTHLSVLERMGLIDDLRERQTGGTPLRFVDANGRTQLYLPADFAGGEIEVLRSVLSRLLYERSRERTKYVFGDSVARITEGPGGVEALFESGTSVRFDLVIDADGMYSRVRRLSFENASDHIRHLGYYLAGWDLANYLELGPESLMYNVPGRLASLGGDHHDSSKASTLFVFASERVRYDRGNIADQRRIIESAFEDLGWEVPRLIASLPESGDLYFDSIGRVDLDAWSRGRVALIGDAAHGATLGGMGTGAAVVGAYVLANELAAAGGDHLLAFQRYEQRLRKYATECQKGGDRAGSFLAPRTAFGIKARNALLNRRTVLNWMIAEGRKVAGGVDLDDYSVLS